MKRALGLLALLILSTPARAEDLLLALSSLDVTIASNWAGADVTVFGTVREPMPGRAYQLVITTSGPTETLVVHEKGPVAGLWVTKKTSRFPEAPSFLSVLSNAPLDDIADPEERMRARLGLAEYARGDGSAPRAARQALMRLQNERGLWVEDEEGVSFDPQLFHATVHLPSNTPFGAFEVEGRLYADKTLVARRTISFRVAKAGFEAKVADVAERIRLGYGVGVAGLALLFGWAASAMFRRD
jgi:uncharacterized protein (TIGR02186 family)